MTPFTTTLVLLSLHALLALASPSRLEDRAELPVIEPPQGSFRAARYNKANDVYVFKNISYAAPPTGDLRWAKPAPPVKKSGIQNGGYGPSCPQSLVKGINFVGPGNQSPVVAAVNQFLGGIPIPSFQDSSEDCLYLDIYVPSKAIHNPSSKLAVAVFIYGGGYVMGSKDVYQPHLPFYDGSGLLTQGNGDLVFVAFNYRLGAYGFLAGTTMERDGLPNAGLWDQRAALQWVQDNISKFGGDKGRVTAIGESAGAGSIIHHLVARGGELDPLFHRAVILSPAYQSMWDRAGTVEDTFKRFESLARCSGKGLSCLRAASPKALAFANDQLIGGHLPLGSFAVGPTPEGDFIRQLPVLELSTNNFWKPESLVLSLSALVFLPAGILFGGISWALQSYLTSYAITGDPNSRRATWNLPPAIRWGRPDSTGKGDRVGGVLNVGNWYYSTVDDEQMPKRECDFWREFASAATLSGGYAPPGAGVVRQGLVDVGGRDVSARFTGGNEA